MSTIVISQISLQSFVADRTRLEVGDKVRIAVQFSELQLDGSGVPQVDPGTGLNVLQSEAVTVNTYNGTRIPLLALSNGGTAHYVGGSGSSTLLFEYTVAAADNSTRPGQGLSVVAFAENDASIVSTADYTAAIQPAVIRRADVTIRATDLNGYPENNDILSPNGSLASWVAVKATDQTVIDLIPPKLTGIGSESGVYGQGDVVEFTVNFNEIVVVDASENAGLPTLSLISAGQLLPVVASYAGGSGTKSLTFRYEVAEDDPVAGGVNVSSFNFNGGQVTDLSGNVADVAIVGGQNDLSASTSITIDGANTGTGDNGGDDNGDADTTPATIQNIVAVEGDGTYFSGAELTFKVKLSEAVTVDTNSGIPLLILSNGGVAIYQSGSGTDELQFSYTVKASDRNAQTLTVLGVAENDATLLDAGGNATDVRVNAGNNLNISNQVQISAAAPYVRTIEGADGIYLPGEEIQLTVRLSEAVAVDGIPGLRLSNGGLASYQSGSGGDTLVFSYVVPTGSNFSSADLDVSGFAMGSGGISSVSSTNAVSRVLRPGIMALSNAVEIDATPPTGTIEIDAVALKKGDSATVTLTFSEPVANPFSAIEVNGGTLDPLVTDETSEPGTVWKGTFRPNQDIEIAANTLVLDNSKVMDNPPSDFGEGQDPSEWSFGNYGVGLSETQPFEVDTKSPVAEITSETLAGEGAVTNRLVTVNFGEPVYGLSEGSITVQGGRKVPGTFTELSSGVYQIVVAPVDGSGVDADKLSFGVSLLANAVTDAAGNSNVQLPSSTFTWDETAPAIASIRGTSGSYVTGDVVSLLVDFDEVVQVTTPAGGMVPALALSNGSLAHYVSGGGSQVLRFDYVVSAGDEATDLSVLALFENDGTIRDASGNDARVAIGSSNGLSSATSILIDGVVPTITTMKADDGLYTSGDVIGIAVQFSEAVHVDESEGSPILALSNGAVARYVGGSETSLLHFEYTVAEGDYDAQDLDVLALAEEGSVITEFYGRAAEAVEIKTSSDFNETSDGFFYVNLDDAVVDDVITFNVTGTTITTDPLSASDLSNLYSVVKTHIVDNAAGVTALRQVQVVQKAGVSYLRFDNSLQPQVDISTAELGDNVNAAIRSELNTLAYRSEVNIDSALPAIAQISANAGYYNAGDTVEIAVAWTKGMIIDTTQGVPSLEMSNGALAVYDPSQSSSTKLLFRYVVDATDNSSEDLSVVGFRAGNARFTGLIAGGDAVLDQLPEQSLSLEGPLTVDVTPPEVESLALTVNREDDDGNAIVVALEDITGGLSAGEKVTVTVTLSEAVQQFSKGYLSVSDGVLSRFVSNEDGTVWTGTYTPYANVSATDQVIRLDQGQLQDMAGNLGSGSFSSAAYSLDSDYPSVVITSDTDGVTKEAVRFVLNFSEAVSGFDPTDASHVVIEGGTLALWSVETPDNSGRPEGEYSFVVEPNTNSTAPIRVYVKEGVAIDAAGNSNERSLVFVQPIDTEKAYIESIEALEGAYNVGDTIAFAVNFNEVVSLNLRDGISDHEMPELFLSNGQTARYVSGSGTDTWHFEYTVATVYDAQGEKVDIDRSPIRVVNVLENDTYLLDGAGNRAEVVVGANHGLTKPVSVDTTGAQITGFDAIDGHTYLEGQVVWIKLTLDEVVTVRAGANGPVLHLDNGGTATYMAGSGSKNLMFRYQVKEGDAVSTDLGVLSLAMGSGAIIDTAGNAMAAVVTDFGSNLSDSRDVAVDTQAPLLEWVDLVEDRSIDTDVINDGYYKAGTTVAFDVSFDDAVYVDTTHGVPTLTLNNGEMATFVDYAGSSESAAQILATITEPGDATTLAEQTLALAGAMVGDDFMPTAGKIRLGFAGIEVSVRVFEGDSLADALAALQTDANYATLPFNLALNTDGDALIATWKQDQADPVTEAITIDRSFGNDVLRFEYTVGQDDLNRTFLEVVGLSENGGSIKDVSGNDALVEVFNTNLRYDTAVVDTKAPRQASSSDSFEANDAGVDEVNSLETVTFNFVLNEQFEFDLSSIDYAALNAQTRSDLGLASDATDAELAEAIAVSIETAEHTLILSKLTVSFDGSRRDANGFELPDSDSGLAATNFRYVADANGLVTGFSVDVVAPDRAMGDLVVSAMPGALWDLATNTNATTISHSQRVDTQTFNLITTPAAGLFIGAQSTVRVKDLNGDILAADVTLNPETGQAKVAVSPNETYPGGYRGPVLIEVIDTDPEPDYFDEFTGEAVTLSDGTTAYVMRALLNVEEPGEIDVTVSPVTELAVTKLEEAMLAAGTTAFDPQQVSDYNAGIGKIFGIDDIVRTPATVVNSALVESQTGADVTNFDATDGIDAAEKYGQVLAMLSARDSQSGSLEATITELAAEIKAVEAGGQTTLAIKQAGADKLAQALDSSSAETDLDGAGVNRTLLDVAYIDEASAAGYGLNLAEAESTSVPVKGAQVGDTVFVQWGVITQPDTNAGEVAGAPNRFEVVIDASHVQADGSIRVPVPLSVIEKQGDATEVAVSTAVIPAGSIDDDGNAITTPAESDYRAPVLLTVDIIPPQTTVEPPTNATPFVTAGAVEGIRGGDDVNVLLNNSTDEHFKYALSTAFLDLYPDAYDGAYAALQVSRPGSSAAELVELANTAALNALADVIPTGLTVSNLIQNPASGTWSFDWSLDLTQAISVAEQSAEAAALEAGESYTPVATFTADDERSVFQVQASTADLVGNADADDARNEVIIGSVDDIVDSAEEQSAMDEALNRLSARYGDAAVDTRAEIKTVADAIDGITALKNSGDPAATAGELASSVQTLVLGSGGTAGTPGVVAAGVYTLSIGDETFAVDLSDAASPTLVDVIAEITGSAGYADLPYTVALDASGNGVDISWKAFGPQPAAASSVAITSTESADQLESTISNPGSLAAFAVQAIAVDGETVDGSFVPAAGDITVGFGGTELSVTIAEGESLADALAGLQGDDDYASLPFRLTINEAGDGLVATWKATQADPVTALITVDRDFDVTTTTETAATIVAAGSAGVTTQELAALDIQSVDDSELAAINRALASDLASVSAPVVSFADSALVAGESTTVSLTFATRVGQVPDDVMALVGGELSSAGEAGDPIWSTTDGLTWTATFTASSDMANTALQYAERVDEDGVVVVDANGNAVLDPVVVDDTTTPVTYGQAGDDLSPIALTEALVNRVTDAAAKVAAFADSQGDVPAASPSVQDFADMAVSGVRDDNLSAVQDALGAIRDRFEGEGDLYTQIQTVTDSYNTVFDTVYTPGATTRPSSADLVEDLSNLGVGNLSTDSARAEDQMTLLQGALRAVAAAKSDIDNGDGTTTTSAEQQADMINSVAKLESFVASVEKVLARANGEITSGDTPTPVSAITVQAVHGTSSYYDASDESTARSIKQGEAIVVSLTTGGVTVTAQGMAASRDDLQSVVEEMNADLVGTGYVVSVAGDELIFARTDEAAFSLSLESGAQSGFYGYLEDVETHADAYPGDNQAFASVSTTLGVSGEVVQVSDADLSALGFESLLADNSANSRLSSLQKVIADQSEGSGSDSIVDYADLKAVLETAVAAFDDIVALTAAAQDTTYVDDAARTQALTAALAEVDADNFQEMGIDGVTDVAIGTLTAAAMADAVKDALSNTGNAINSLESIQQVVDSYRQVLSVASGDVSGDQALISTAQLSDLGVSLSADDEQEPASLATLLSGVIANKAAPTNGASTDNVDSVAEIQALADAAKKVFDNANQSADDGGANASQADLNVLGFDTVDADNLDAIQRVLTRTDSRDGVTSYADLKAKVDAAVDAHAALTTVVSTAQGSGTPDLTGLDQDTFSDMGIDGVDAGNYAAMLDALSNTGNTVDTAAQVQTVVDSYNVLLDLGAYSTDSEAMQPAPATATDLTNIGITLESGTEDAVAELATGIMASLAEANVDTVEEAQAIVDAIDSVFANTLRTSDDDATHTTVVSKDELLTLGFAGATDENLDAIQRVLSDQTDEADVKDYADLKALIDAAITAHSDILNAATTDDLTGIDDADYAAMGVDGVDTDNLGSINDALINSPNTLTTAASVQAVVDSYSHILDLRAAQSQPSYMYLTLSGENTYLYSGSYQIEVTYSVPDIGISGSVTVEMSSGNRGELLDAVCQALAAENEGFTVEKLTGADRPTYPENIWEKISRDDGQAFNLSITHTGPAGVSGNWMGFNLVADDDYTRIPIAMDAQPVSASVSNGVVAQNANIDLVANDFTDLGVILKAAGAEQARQVDYLQELVANNGGPSVASVADIQKLADATSDLIDLIQGNSPDSDSTYGLTIDQWALLGITADEETVGAFNARLALTADDLSEVTNLTTALADRVQESRTALAKIRAYAEADGGTDEPSVLDYNFIGVPDYDAGNSTRVAIGDGSNSTVNNLAAINELLAATGVGADAGDDPATKRSEVQYVIDQNAGRLQALAKIANYADNNGVDLATYPAPDADDFAAAGVSGVADDNNIPALLVKLKSLGSSSNYAATNTAAELQAFVTQVAIEKIKAWTDTDGGNSADPILQDYLNAGLVNHDDSAISAAIVPALNELFAGDLTSAGDADDDTEQQGVIDGAATMLAALTKIANYADADGAIDFSDPADGVNDHLTVADFEAAGISGVADGTDQSVGTGTSVAANGYDNLNAVLAKLAESGIAFINADTVDEVQQLVTDVAVEKINAYADADGLLPLENETISVYVDAKTGGSGNAFYLDNVEAPALELKAGTYTFDQSDTTNDGHLLSFYANADRSGSLPAGVTVTQTGTPGTAGAQTVVVVDETYGGTVYYACSTHDGMGNSAEVDLPYFTPELQDYTNAGLEDPNNSAIVADQVEAINTLFAAADTGGVSGTDTYHADDVANQQAIIDAGSAKLAAIHKIATYARDGSGSALGVPTAADYDAAGVVGVFDANNNGNSLNNIASVNAALTTDAGSYDAANSPVEIQKFASRARITDYADVNGLASDGVTALHADVVPTIADYANVGVTEIYNGTQLVAIDASNLDQVNDLMAMRYVGNPDTDGSGTVDGSDNGRIDVVDNATDAATNETNLDYAGTVDTVAQIQDAVSRALGDAADANSSTFGDRAVALNKIAAFAQAVSTLADQAAYDAYIADAANASGIPTATDYNTAGVLDLTDSTEGISTALATAINAKLFTGGATSAVNTVTELQPYVDAANEVVNKIANYANGTWEAGTSEIDYVDLVYTFANGDFSESVPDGEGYIDRANQSTTSTTGSFQGWNYIIDQIVPGVDTIGGEAVTGPLQTITGASYQPTTVSNPGGANGDLFYSQNTIYNEHISVDTVTTTQADGETGSVLQLQMDIDHFANSNGAQPGARAIYYGPAVYSQETYLLSAGDRVSLDWRALSGGSYGNDASAVVGYLAKVGGAADGSDNILLVQYAHTADQNATAWQSTLDGGQSYVEIGADEVGEYFFVFLAGSGETHGTSSSPGTQVGSTFEIDNIKLTTATGQAPVEFNGITFQGGTVTNKAAQQVFDQDTTVGTGFLTKTASDSDPAVLGWKDDGTFDKEPAVLQSVRITSSHTGFDTSFLPKRFVVEGWDQSQNAWIEIQEFDDDSAVASSYAVPGEDYLEFAINSDHAFTGFRIKAYESFGSEITATETNGDGSNPEVQSITLAEGDLVAGGSYTLVIGNTEVKVNAHGSSPTLADLATKLDAAIDSSVDVTITANGTTGLTLTWDANGEVTDVAKLIELQNSIEISELDFMAKPANQTAGVLTQPDFEAIGITGVTTSNLSAINAGLFGLPDASTVNMLPGIQAHVNRVSAALQRITDFANSDGAGDTDYNFTNSGSETAVPTVADFNAIGLHFYRTADGRYHEITDNNIAAINEILALAAIGDHDGDLPAATFENVKTILETDVYTKRLVAIEKISQVVDNSAISVTLLDDTGTPTVVENQTISLVLESVFGTETVSATIGVAGDWSWSSIATEFSLDLASNSGFTISAVAGGIKVERVDGQAFSVKGSGSADDFALSVDGASPAVSIGAASSTALTGIASVAGSGVQLTVADFAAAGISAIDANNIEAAVQSYVAKTNSTELDTVLELTAVAFPPTQTITIDGISRETGGELSRETLAVVEDYDGNFNQYVYTIDESSISVGDVFEIVVNGETVTTAPIASADKTGIIQALSAVMPKDGSTPVANVINNTGQDIFKLQIRDTYNSGDTAPAISRFVAPSDFITSDDDGLTVSATLSAALAAGQMLMYSNDNGETWTDITSSVSGTDVSYADATLTSSATIKLKVVNAAGEETTPVSQAVTIDTAPPSAPSIAQSGKTLTITGEAGAVVRVFNGATEVTDKFAITELSSGLYQAVAKPGSFAGTETLSLTAKLMDAAGNVSAASGAVTGAIDATAPSAPTLSLSGKTVTVTGEAGGSVKIFDGGSDISHKFTISEASGTYSAVANLAAFTGSESLSLTATITDASGNESATQTAVTGTIDTTAPSFVSQSGTYFDTTGTENYFDEPRITQLPNGEYVVGWLAYTSGSDISLYTQRLDTNGDATGSRLNHNKVTVTNSALFENNMSIVSLDTDGTYAVVWEHYNSSSTNGSLVSNQPEITVQVVKPDDTLETAYTLTTASNSDRKVEPTVVEYDTGKFVVTYSNGSQAQAIAGGSYDIYTNVKAAFFTKAGAIDTSMGTSGYLDLDADLGATNIDIFSSPLIVKQPSTGDIIFAWTEHDGTDFNIAVTVYDVSGNSFSTKVVLDHGTDDKDGLQQIVTKSDGTFTVFWESTDGAGATTIVAQPFDAAGATSGSLTTISGGSDPQVQDFGDTSTLGAIAYKAGSDVKVSAFTASGFSTAVTLTDAHQGTAYQLVEMAAGKFAVVYGSDVTNLYNRVAVQKFNADGTADGSAILLPAGSNYFSSVLKPQVSYDAGDGSLLVAWNDGGNSTRASTGSKTDGIWLHKVLSDGTVETTSSSFGFGTVLDYGEAGNNQTLSVLTSGVEDGETVTLTLNGKTYTGTISSDAASISVPTADLVALESGSVTYTIDVDDTAGNSATQFSGSFVKNGISFAGIDVDGDTTLDFTDPSATAGTDASTDGTIDIVLDVSDAVAGDVYELYVDGTLINTNGTVISQTDINNGKVTVSNVDVDSKDSTTAGTGVNANADEVLIEIKLKSSGSYITDGTDTQWDYQW